jgi:hypothetical protein
MKTVIGSNKYLYLKSELDQHYTNDKNNDNELLCNFNYYFNEMQKKNKNFLVFVVPDKSVICNENIPHIYNKNKLSRFANFIKKNICSQNFIDLYDHCKLTQNDYYITDTHINHKCSLKIVKTIVNYFIDDDNKINEIDNFLTTNIVNNYYGDLTSPINLENQELVKELKLYEDIEQIINICYCNYVDKIREIPIQYRFCYTRQSKYIYNENAIIKKKILVYGDSTTSNKIIELLSFYFENTFFYWNHYFLYDDLVKYMNPDILIDIRTERFLSIDNHIYNTFKTYDSPFDKKYNLLSYDEIYSILVNMNNYAFNLIINNLNNLCEIKNNCKIFSSLLVGCTNYILPYINMNKKIVLELNPDLLIFYNIETDIEISDLKLLNFINDKNNNRKYKYENIPENFNAIEYIELNEDLKNMTELQAKNHYEHYGYKENRKYKYENIPDDFNNF